MKKGLTHTQAKTFMLAVLTVSVPTWTVAFNLGVYGEVFFEHTVYILVASLVLLLAQLFVPQERSPIKGEARFVLALPVVWAILSIVNSQIMGVDVFETILFWFGLVAIILCLPYIFYILSAFTNPEVIEVARYKLTLPLLIIVVVIGITGYLVGDHNAIFMTCFDFEVSGNMVPDNCRR